jgi:glycosyltransferase involved in cell wall biosynthesis
MVQLVERLPRDRFAPEFILLSGRGPLADRAERTGVPVTVLHWRRGRSVTNRLPDLWRLVGTLRRGRFDIVDAWLFHAYAITSLTRPVTRIPVLIAGRRSLSHHKHRFGRVERLLDRIARRSVDAIVANSDAVRAEVARYEGIDIGRMRVIHNGLDIPAPLPPAARDALRAAWGVGPDDVLIGCVANYKSGKGQEMLIRAIARALPGTPRLKLILVGEGPRRPELERLVDDLGIHDAVLLHGAEPDARDIIGAFDIAAQASVSEGLPNAVLEAAAAGLPIVATDAGGTAEILDQGRTGILVPIDDEAAMAAAISRLSSDPDLRRSLGESARSFVESAFGLDRFVAETASLYEELAAARGIR